VPRGGTVSFTVVADAGSRFVAPCTDPLHLRVEDSTEFAVYSASAPSGPVSPCGSVTVRVGSTAVYTTAWPVDPTLPTGRYDVELVLGDLPALQLQISVGFVPQRRC